MSEPESLVDFSAECDLDAELSHQRLVYSLPPGLYCPVFLVVEILGKTQPKEAVVRIAAIYSTEDLYPGKFLIFAEQFGMPKLFKFSEIVKHEPLSHSMALAQQVSSCGDDQGKVTVIP